MGQVPSFLVVGNGRVARHLYYYLTLLGHQPLHWHRGLPETDLPPLVDHATHALILISDRAIDGFIQKHLLSGRLITIHCSGSLVSDLAFGAHPLFTFNEQLYDLQTYKSIPFVIDHDAPAVEALLPGLPNNTVRLDKKLKSKYHALCVLSANFSCLLWQKLFNAFEQELNIPAQLANPLLLQQTKNLYHTPKHALTGPLTRNDQETIAKNLAALTQDPFQRVYQSFIECYAQLIKGAS